MKMETEVEKHIKSSLSKTINLGKGVLVSFKDLAYTVQDHRNRKQKINILDGVSGYVRPKEMLALMGPSGCGKTTLMDILAGRKTVGDIQGDIRFGGIKPSMMFLRRYTGYVEQFDTLVPILTVEEMFLYTALLKLERNVSIAEKRGAVERVIDVLGLETCRKVLIGNNMVKGISGGQAKRVNVGIALISNPRVLFLDEPTTGLDSFTSNEVISVIKNLASSGITVCATIHSPSPYTFAMFDKLLLMLKGKTIYFGKNSGVIPYLQKASSSFAMKLGDLHVASESEWITDTIMNADREGFTGDLIDFYEHSGAKADTMEELASQLQETKQLPEEFNKMLAVKKATTTPSWYGLLILMRFRMLKNYCTGVFYASHAAPWIIQTLIIFSTFWMVAKDLSEATVGNVTGILFFWTVTPAFGAASYIPSIMLSRPLFFRERNDGLYRSITFLCYLTLEELFVAIPVTLLINTIMWFGLKLAGSFILWWVSFFITYIAGIMVSYAICSISPSIDVANAAVPIFGVICLFFSGFLIRLSDVGWWWRWLVYACPTFWSFGAQMNNFFSGDRNIPYLNTPSVTSYYGVDWMSAWEFVAMQVIFVFVFFILALLGLSFYKPISR